MSIKKTVGSLGLRLCYAGKYSIKASEEKETGLRGTVCLPSGDAKHSAYKWHSIDRPSLSRQTRGSALSRSLCPSDRSQNSSLLLSGKKKRVHRVHRHSQMFPGLIYEDFWSSRFGKSAARPSLTLSLSCVDENFTHARGADNSTSSINNDQINIGKAVKSRAAISNPNSSLVSHICISCNLPAFAKLQLEMCFL